MTDAPQPALSPSPRPGAATTRRNSDLRQRNSADVVDLLGEHGRMSRAMLAEHTTLSHQALATILNELVESGHVLEVETRGGARGRGRPALQYEYNPHRVTIAALYVGLRYCEVALCDGLGRPLAAGVELAPGWDVDRVVNESAARIGELVDRHGIDPSTCRIAAVVHGSVDAARRSVTIRDMAWDAVPLGDLLEQRMGIETSVHEAARAAAIAEYREGGAVGARRAIVLNVGPEMVATEVRHGVVDTGARGLAGAIGRCGIETPDGPRAIHEALGTFAIKQQYTARSGVPVEWMTEVLDRARAGDPNAWAVLEPQIEAMATASMWLLTIGNPDRFVVTGSIADYGERASARLHQAIVSHTDEEVLRGCSIRFSTLGRQAWIRGGIHAALDRQRQLDHAAAALGRA